MSDYHAIIEKWVREFVQTMNEDPQLGDQSGSTPLGVKIIFNDYDPDEGEDTSKCIFNFIVFIHKNSLNGKSFPEHEQTAWGLVHRPEEEVAIYCYYDANNDVFDLNPFEDGDTELDHQLVYQLIRDVDSNNEA